jgi:hypothetical protein
MKDNPLIIGPFMKHRKALAEQIEIIEAEQYNKVGNYYEYLLKCIGIIANMLDKSKMGSIEHYLNHIWEGLEETKKNEKVKEFMAIVQEISDIITMIDLACEDHLNQMNKGDIERAVAQYALKHIDPNLEILGVFNINNDGSIKKIDVGTDISKDEDNDKSIEHKWDLENMTPLNIEEI